MGKISVDDLNMIYALIGEAEESLDRKARENPREASYYRHRIKEAEKLYTRIRNT
jgi:hypothetical protein